jgi:nitroreductase
LSVFWAFRAKHSGRSIDPEGLKPEGTSGARNNSLQLAIRTLSPSHPVTLSFTKKEVIMEVFEAIKTMLAVREYQPQPIPYAVLMRILEAARLTGSSRNRQQWDFVVVRNPANLQRLGQLASTGSFIANAPLAIAVIVPEGTGGAIDGARAVQDMMLAAWEEGVGSNWVGNVNTPEVREMLTIPQGRMVLTIIPFGYPTRQLGAGRKERKPLAEVAHEEKFGQPWQSMD